MSGSPATSGQALAMGGVAALVTTVACLAGAWWLDHNLRHRWDSQLERARRSVDRTLAAGAADTEDRLSRVLPILRREQPEALVRVLAAEADPVPLVLPVMERLDLDALEIVDGQVLVSAAWPERVGLPPPDWAPTIDAVAGTSIALGEITPMDRSLLYVSRRRETVHDRPIDLFAARRVDLDELARIAAADAVEVRLDGRVVGRFGSDEPFSGEAPGSGLSERGVWIVDAAPTSFPGVQARVALDRTRDLTRRAWVRAGLALVALAAFGTALIAGALFARRTGRRVDELVARVDAIARGERDYAHLDENPRRDEFEALALSFSRLQRSLELQRQRSRAAERIAAWREVARHVAHEVKNPLAPIQLTVQNLQRVRRELPGEFDAMFDEGAATILEEVDQLSRLVGEFSEFARLPAPRRERVRLEPLLRDAVALFASEPDLDVGTDIAELPELRIDRDQMARAFKNIIGNAVEAMAGQPGPARLEVRARVENGQVSIEFLDEGPGLAPEAAGRLFQPYVTTRETGTGLGLAIVYRIVTEHGGMIEASDREGGGARFRVLLPIDGSTDPNGEVR